MIPGAETFAIDQKNVHYRANKLVTARLRSRALSAITLLRKAPKREFQNNRAKEIDPSRHRQQRSYKKSAEESPLFSLRKQGNFFWPVEHRHFNSQ